MRTDVNGLTVFSSLVGKIHYCPKEQALFIKEPGSDVCLSLYNGDTILVGNTKVKIAYSLFGENLPSNIQHVRLMWEDGQYRPLFTVRFPETVIRANAYYKNTSDTPQVIILNALPCHPHKMIYLMEALLFGEAVRVDFVTPRLADDAPAGAFVGHLLPERAHTTEPPFVETVLGINGILGHIRDSLQIGDALTILNKDGSVFWKGRMTKRRKYASLSHPKGADIKALAKAAELGLVALVKRP